MAFLTAINGPKGGQSIELKLARSILGRHPSCQIVIDANAVSRHHAQILWDGSKFMIEDMNSRNGTFLNDRLISGNQLLRDGDQIKVCEYLFRFDNGIASGARSGKRTQQISSGFVAAQLVDDSAKDESPTITSRLGVSQKSSLHTPLITAEKRLHTLIEISQALSKALVLDEVLPKVLDSLFQIFVQAQRGFIFLREKDGNLATRWYLTRRLQSSPGDLRVSRTIINHVLEKKEAILSADAAQDQRFDVSQSVVISNIHSIMCAPIMDNDEHPIGCIQIDTFSQTARFKEADLEVLATVAMQAGIAIENARLLEAALEQREFQRDLELAHEVQHAILPRLQPQSTGYEFFDFYQPAHHIGGDYFDYVQLSDGRVAVLVADVVGHGITAALLMAKISSEVRFALASHRETKPAIEALNLSISNLSLDRFITLVVAVIDTSLHQVTFVNAGHNPPLICHKSGIQEVPLDISGLPIGITSSSEYAEYHCTLEPGDFVVMYTDGLTECVNRNNEMYDLKRLKKLLASQQDHAASRIGELLVEDMKRFVGDRSFLDDVCIVCFNRSAS